MSQDYITGSDCTTTRRLTTVANSRRGYSTCRPLLFLTLGLLLGS